MCSSRASRSQKEIFRIFLAFLFERGADGSPAVSAA
jgi:hypothetical protein